MREVRGTMIKLTAKSKYDISKIKHLFIIDKTPFDLTGVQREKVMKILKKPIIGFSIKVSSPNGIGPEVIVKYIKENGTQKTLDLTDVNCW